MVTVRVKMYQVQVHEAPSLYLSAKRTASAEMVSEESVLGLKVGGDKIKRVCGEGNELHSQVSCIDFSGEEIHISNI